ncbi:transmembrane protein [Rhodotorula diobovata]|uniref:Transmembrane protein n=1 Tax=Rhodotorula diobovata TaxID=5288 RepID=A0A5C5G0C4_9BASI|nr:transmembrane protein [Rhodotorula diobovata]
MSNLIPSTLRTRSDSSPTPSSSSSSSDTSDTSPALSLPEHLYTDCQSCRVTGTLTFSAVGLYALTVSRVTAKTPVGKGAASLMGLGFLAVAAARWTAYSPPPPSPSDAQPS